MLKLGKINREKMCKIIQKSTIRGSYKCKQLFGGGVVSTDTLNSEAIIDKYRRL